MSSQPAENQIHEVPSPEQDTSRRRTMAQIMAGAGRQFWGRLIILVLFALPVVAIYAGHLLYQTIGQIADLQLDGDAAGLLVHQLRTVGFLFLSVIILLCLLGIYFLFFLSVRIYGPQVAILRFIDQLKQGNYDRYRNLRKDDQLKEIWQGLQELASILKSRH